jgi:hypothetical protein
MRGPAGNTHTRTFRAQVVSIPAGRGVIIGTAEDQANLPGGANVQCLGITAAATVAVDDPLPVVMFGETVAEADAAITAGSLVMVNAATGRVAAIGAVAGTNYWVLGVALTATAAQGDDVLVFVCPSRAQG